MSVPAHTEAYGEYTKYFDGKLHYRKSTNSSGAVTEEWTISKRNIDTRSERSGYSKNVPILVKGKPFRKPSGYYRGVAKCTHSAGRVVLNQYGTTHLREGIGDMITGSTRQLPVFTSDYPSMVLQTGPQSAAHTKALIDLGGQKVNYVQSIAEAKRTHSGLVDQSIRLLSAMRSVRRGNFKLAAKHLGLRDSKGWADNWLFYQYGLLPLLGDIKGTYEVLKSQLTTPPLIISGHGSETWTIVDKEKVYLDFRNRKGVIEGKSSCKLYGKVSDSYLRTATQFGLSNPIGVAWELVPWSFVVDWYLPVGNAIEALTAPLGLDFIGGYTSQRCVASLTADYDGWPGSGTPYRVRNDRHSYERRILQGWPRPLPRIKSPFSTTRAYTALALLRQLQK